MYQPNDMKIALTYMLHIKHPCVEPITGHNIREYWLRLATEGLKALKDPQAISLLEATIQESSK